MDLSHLVRIGLLPGDLGSSGATDLPKSSKTLSKSQPGHTPVFFLAGQSNMVGRGKPADLAEDVAGKAAQCSVCYDHDRNFAEDAGVPHLRKKSWTPLTAEAQDSYDGKDTHFGPEFGIANHLGYPVHFAKFAMGSTNLHTHWRPDGPYFKHAVQFIKDALDTAPQPAKLEAIFWLQGESDSTGNAKQVGEYEENLVQLFSALRKELGDVPVVASQVDFHSRGSSKRPKRLGQVNAAIERACSRDDMQPAQCSLLPGEMSTWDDGHLDSQALLQIGTNMAAAYEALQTRISR